MTLEDFIKMCKDRDWEGLLDLFPSDISDMGVKIAATAIIGKYHPDAEKRDKYGLGMWKTLLSAAPTSSMFTMVTGAVSLLDFTNAYLLLKYKMTDQLAADRVYQFVRENKNILGQFLNHPAIPQEVKDHIKEIFGNDLTLSKKEKEAFFAREMNQERLKKIEKIKAKERINDALPAILQLKQSEFKFSYSEPSSMGGIVSGSAEGKIRFTQDIEYEEMKKVADYLNTLGLKTHAYDGGIQIFGSLQSIDEILSAHQSENKLKP